MDSGAIVTGLRNDLAKAAGAAQRALGAILAGAQVGAAARRGALGVGPYLTVGEADEAQQLALLRPAPARDARPLYEVSSEAGGWVTEPPAAEPSGSTGSGSGASSGSSPSSEAASWSPSWSTSA